MKSLVVLLGLTTATLLSGVAAVKVSITAYSATGELDISTDPFTLGTRVLLTCDVTGLPEGSEVVRYRWFHSLKGDSQERYQIKDRHSYYTTVNDTLLVDVTSLNHRGKYTCFVSFSNEPQSSGSTALITVAGNNTPFLYIPTALLPEHSVLTDVQLATGSDGHEWIKCNSGGQGNRPEIWMGSELVVNSSTANSATIALGSQTPNGLYHCLSAQSQREYFSLFFHNSGTLPTPTASVWNNSLWSFKSPESYQVERYIVEFECRVRSITFVEKYMSVSTSGGTGRVATSASCFGGLGQLYRVKVWAVSGPNISRALVCAPDGQCREEEGHASSCPEPTTVYTPATSPLPTTTPEPNTGTKHSIFELPLTPVVIVAISAANTLLLLISLAILIASCAVLKKAKRSRQKCTAAHNYTAADYEVKVARVDDDSETISEYADVADLPIPSQKQYQTLQTGTLNNHQYATATRHSLH